MRKCKAKDMWMWNIIAFFFWIITEKTAANFILTEMLKQGAVIKNQEDAFLQNEHQSQLNILHSENDRNKFAVNNNYLLNNELSGTDLQTTPNVRKRVADVALWNHLLVPQNTEVSLKSETERSNRRPWWRQARRYPFVKVTVDGSDTDPNARYVQFVSLEPEMSVFQALLSAAIRYHRSNYGRHRNPFDAILDWDYSRDCEVVTEVIDTPNTSTNQWKVQVWRRRRRLVYNDICLPSERLRMRPGTNIVLRYT